MTSKCYQDNNGNYICSDEYLFPENPEDIIDFLYIKDVWYCNPSEVYKEILEENKHIHKVLFKGII